MALIVKLRHSFGHRWMPFFIPVVGSLLYILLAVLLVPDSLSNDGKSGADADTDQPPAAATSAARPAGSLARPPARRAPRIPTRPIAGVAPGVAPAAPPAPPAAIPASPDGNE